MTLQLALAGQDLIGQAKTGTGKTLGFGIPALVRIVCPGDDEWADFAAAGKPQALIIVPTRELAIQVSSDLERAAEHLKARIIAVYGGKSYEPQIAALAAGVEIVVGTPGRLIDLNKQGYLNLKSVRALVLDEADEMLDMGFLPDVERIVAMLPTNRQTMLFSATMPGQIVALARRYMTSPTHVQATDPNSDSATVDAIEQHVWRAHQMDKPELIARVLQADQRGLTMIFCRTKRTASNLTDDLISRGFACAAVHGDLGQGAREQALRAFRSGKIDVLVATDVAARGIDVADVTHVINYECPEDDKTYVHRIGRTGRAGNTGVAITLVDWPDMARWQMINKTLGLPFHDPLETYSSSDHVYTGLNISRDVKGQLPNAQRTRAGLGAEQLEDLGGAKPRNKSPKSGTASGARGSAQRDGKRSGQRNTRTSAAPKSDVPARQRDTAKKSSEGTRQRTRTRGQGQEPTQS